MAVDVIMPQMGESIFEGTITKWLKKPGDKVERDEPLFEISTDKVDAEIPAPAAGVLTEIKVAEGQTVPDPDRRRRDRRRRRGSAAVRRRRTSAGGSPATAAQRRTRSSEARARNRAGRRPTPSAPSRAGAQSRSERHERIRSSPLVRRLARENNIDLATRSRHRRGRAHQQEGHPRRPSPRRQRRRAAAGRAPQRRRRRLPASHAHARDGRAARAHLLRPLRSAADERDAPAHRRAHGALEARLAARLLDRRSGHDAHRATARERPRANSRSGTRPSSPSCPSSCAPAWTPCAHFPLVNASVDGTNVVLHREINIGIAVALDWGLIVPVIKNAEEKNFLGLQRAINDLAERARAKKLKPEEVQESTFSITNPGIFGGLMGLPVINQPNVAILGIGAIQKRPVVVTTPSPSAPWSI